MIDSAKQGLKIKSVIVFILAIIMVGLLFFLPAGTVHYWQAWAFMAALFLPCIFIITYLLNKDPKLLERRMHFKEKETEQKAIIKLTNIFLIIGFMIPGLDHRFGWSKVPISMVIIADVLIIFGYMIVFFVFRENSYTSRVIEVDKKQKVISTGPYSVIRHPMYTGVILMFISTPIALGSYWALLFFIPVLILLIFRTLNEEKVLKKDLKGYKGYCLKVKYRLIPGIW